ncbi:MAG: hypothetical protein HY996_02710 [Micrococcales bacterium]|nr:hypothetical protein [Micrococcales bacterium]
MTESPRRTEVDPRYAALFQRGYDPAEHASVEEPERAASEPAASEPAASEPAAPEPAAPEPAAPDPTAAPAPPAAPPPAPAGSVDPAAEPAQPPADPNALVPTRSGWRLALPVGVVSLGFLVASAVLVLTPAPAEASFVLSFPALLRATLQPALALGGGIGLAVTIVVAALRIRDDAPDASHDPGPSGPEIRG